MRGVGTVGTTARIELYGKNPAQHFWITRQKLLYDMERYYRRYAILFESKPRVKKICPHFEGECSNLRSQMSAASFTYITVNNHVLFIVLSYL